MDIDREKEGKCLTVTVPCYNSESYLERCVESLLKERDGLEIILVDDGSSDGSKELCDELAKNHTRTWFGLCTRKTAGTVPVSTQG